MVSVRPLILKQLTWDLVPHEDTDEVLRSLGLVPSNNEISELEHKDAHLRELMMTPTLPIITNVTTMAVEVLCHYCKCKGMAPDWMSDDEKFEQIQRMVHGVVIGVLTAITTTNVLQLPVTNANEEGIDE